MAVFTDLPSEMRNSIYDMLLIGPAPSLGVLGTSRLIHGEAASYYYQNNAFEVSLMSQSETLLPPIPDRYLKYLRRLTINVCLTSSRVHDSARRIEALANTGATLASLTINLISRTSRVLSNRVDDNVLSEDHPIALALHHLLSSSVAQSMRVNLEGVWFAPGLATKLLNEFEGTLEVLTTLSSLERALVGQKTQTHLRALDIDTEAATDRLPSPPASPSPSDLSTALSELDQFSPMEFFDEYTEEVEVDAEADLLIDEPMFDAHDNEEGHEEELTEEDDVADEEMEDIDNFEAILGGLGEIAQQRANEADISYMTNFAPEMLGRWIEGTG
ncbi:hypothetical protein C7974DRAFT_472073 [Boeremia exigua]|uniref:uncharacterized protein n=1 Tax=Boeremia exigua TaxID=749465 RepID=UPI001E8D857A|nr:uncharacterized protein C7974DRAFT_472073 [Boeremia exigua]KAH6629222.1 hypothetical protein C7974DRAFT_472073 [Boeremia exigua]